MNISCCIPYFFQNSTDYVLPLKERVLNRIERYFQLFKRGYFEIQPPLDSDAPYRRRRVYSSSKESCSVVFTVLKILSYITLIIPLLVFLARWILRYPYKFFQKDIIKDVSSDVIEGSSEEEILFEKVSSREEDIVSSSLLSIELRMNIEKEQDTTEQLDVSEEDSSGIFPKWLEKKSLNFPEKIEISADPKNLDKDQVGPILEKRLIQLSHYRLEPGIHIIKRRKVAAYDAHYVWFQLEGYEGIVFKTIVTSRYGSTVPSIKVLEQWNQIMIQDRAIIESCVKEHSLTHLYIPKIQVFKVLFQKRYQSVIAEEWMNFPPKAAMSLVWRAKERHIQEALKELVRLIQIKNVNDIHFDRCVPFCKNGVWFLGLINLSVLSSFPRKEVLHPGLEELVGILHSEESMAMVCSELPHCKVKVLKEYAKIWASHREKINKHEAFHMAKKSSPYEVAPLKLTAEQIEKLGLDLDEEAFLPPEGIITMREAVQEVIKELNEKSKRNNEKSVLSTQRLFFETASNKVVSMPICLGKVYSKHSSQSSLDELWLRRILQSLWVNKHIHYWEVIPGQCPDWTNTLMVWL